jgi:hypothetical protein
MCGIILRIIDKKFRRGTLFKFYKAVIIQVLMYGSESWVITAKYCQQLYRGEFNVLLRVKGHLTICTNKRRPGISAFQN